MRSGTNPYTGPVIFFLLLIVSAVSAGEQVTGELVTASEERTTSSHQSSFDTVMCQLPGQIRKIGAGFTTLAPGRRVQTTTLHCAQHGGKVIEQTD